MGLLEMLKLSSPTPAPPGPSDPRALHRAGAKAERRARQRAVIETALELAESPHAVDPEELDLHVTEEDNDTLVSRVAPRSEMAKDSAA